VLNAVERVLDSYETQCAKTRQDLAIAKNQLRDYEARLGATFPHTIYMTELAGLRDQLKAALSSTGEHHGDAAELAERIKALKAANTIEATQQRHTARAAAAVEEPVTTRIRHRLRGLPTPQPEAEPLVPVSAPEPTPLPVSIAPTQASQPSLFEILPPRPVAAPTPPRPKILYQERARETQRPTGQLRLFG
jgi:hypothetical protein